MDRQKVLYDPLRNKGTGFTQKEREALGLEGFLPYHIFTLEEQVRQRYQNFKVQQSDLAKYLFLSSLQNQNEVLFYKLVEEHITEMLPLIYTPTVGHVSLHYSLLYSHSRGIYLSYPLKDKVKNIICSLPKKEIDVVVITDGERILGLGDLGAGGMAISIGKLALYTLFGGISPARTLPVMIDVGTNNPQLLEDPFYIGWRHSRIDGKAYDDFIEEIVQALKKKYPKMLLQWEDFGREHARPLLERYREKICSFNDDIQGTAAVVLAAVLASIKLTKTKLQEQKIVVLGGGSAGIGIVDQLMGAMLNVGISEEEAKKAFYIVDIQGLVYEGLSVIPAHQKFLARKREEISLWNVADVSKISLLEVVQHVRPTILIGVSTQAGAFTEEIVRTMANYVERPVILPLSNPTSKSEAHPSDLILWTKGKAIIATGSPFEPVSYQGNIYPIAQCNNVSIFPGVGLGIVACKSKRVTDAMFYKAAEILAEHSPMLRDPFENLFPSFEDLKKISRKIAIEVIKIAQKEKLTKKTSEKEIKKLVDKTVWTPSYYSPYAPKGR